MSSRLTSEGTANDLKTTQLSAKNQEASRRPEALWVEATLGDTLLVEVEMVRRHPPSMGVDQSSQNIPNIKPSHKCSCSSDMCDGGPICGCSPCHEDSGDKKKPQPRKPACRSEAEAARSAPPKSDIEFSPTPGGQGGREEAMASILHYILTRHYNSRRTPWA